MHALHLGFLGIDGIEHTGIFTIQEVAQQGTPGLVDVVRRAHNNDTIGMEELLVDHSSCIIIWVQR